MNDSFAVLLNEPLKCSDLGRTGSTHDVVKREDYGRITGGAETSVPAPALKRERHLAIRQGDSGWDTADVSFKLGERGHF